MPDYQHFFLTNTSTSAKYTATGGGGGTFRSPPRDSNDIHGPKLLNEFETAVAAAAETSESAQPNAAGLESLILTLTGDIGDNEEDKKLSGLDLEKLSSDAKDIRIINVREDGNKQLATIAIPEEQVEYFKKKFVDYIEKEPRKKTLDDGTTVEKPHNQKLVESISELRLAKLPDYYTDSDFSPPAPDESIWWEVWLERLEDAAAFNSFKDNAAECGIEFSPEFVPFPEVTVVLAKGTFLDWSRVPSLFLHLAELRRAKIVASEFLDLPPSDQAEFIQHLLERTSYADSDAPAVTILDTGINRGHPLIEPALDSNDTQAWDDSWSVADAAGHGTELAGVAIFGPRLKELLLESDAVELRHRLESVKVLPDVGENSPPDYGPITVGSMAKAEQMSPQRSRVFCLAVTADDRDQYRPSLWSAAIDQAVAGSEARKSQLIAISAGNLLTTPGENYPDQNQLSSVQDPSQAWNALTIGAYTEMVQLQEPDFKGWNAVAPKGLLSPQSTTSVGWRDQTWPIKPEIVLEGGNFATDGSGSFSDAADLSLLTTRLDPSGALLGSTHATSPATAQAARIAAIIQSAYPAYWPETVRGMLVHNADWTKEMIKEFPARDTKGKLKKVPPARLRAYGWGVPKLSRCLACANHVATMVIQDSIQPYGFGSDGKPATHGMKFHDLPLPIDELRQLGEEQVRMRVTLSYFIEPSPGRKGWNVKHRYASHGLRFDVLRPLESEDNFKKRISRDFWDGSADDETKRVRPKGGPKDDRTWVIGDFGQTKGSIHSDFWVGSASQLADSGQVAVYPVTGWWRERPGQGRVESQARYSLIVTIQTRKTDITLYNWVANRIAVPIEIEVEANPL